MSSESLRGDAKEHSSDGTAARKSRGFPFGKIVIGLALAALGGWTAMRIRAASSTRAELAVGEEKVRAAIANPGPLKVQIVHGAPEQWQPAVPIEGSLAPMRESDLGFKTGGRLASVRVRLGDRVRAGQVLATLDSLEAGAQLQAAQAGVRAAEAQLALTRDVERRTTALVKSGTTAAASGVQVEQQVALVTAQLDAARAQQSLAASMLANHTLTAAFPGVVTRVPAGPGAIVGPGLPLFHVQDTGTLKLVATVSPQDAALVKVGAPIDLRVEGREVRGKVIAVLGSVDLQTRRVPVEAEVKNDLSPPLLAGSFVRAAARRAEPLPVLRLPGSALRPGSQDELLIVENGKLALRHVTYTSSESSLLVRDGLRATDAVWLTPSPEAHEGQAVVVEPTAPTAATASAKPVQP